eukprot:SAG11_NODE_2141_length_3756_cov_1.771124_1_plen_96_part_00
MRRIGFFGSVDLDPFWIRFGSGSVLWISESIDSTSTNGQSPHTPHTMYDPTTEMVNVCEFRQWHSLTSLEHLHLQLYLHQPLSAAHVCWLVFAKI